MAYLPFPAPVHLGVVTSGGDQAKLHRFTGERNLSKMEKLLKTGVDVDCVNHQGQTPLFCAALWGFVKVTDLLLDYGADPNHRCEDSSTPVHAGVFSCNPSVVSSLLDAGGDLRLHDQEGQTPFDWLRSAPQESRTKMEDFLQSCISNMQQLFLSPDKMKICSRSPYSSTSSLLRDKKFNKKMMSRCSSTAVFSLGFGKLCVNQTCAGVSVPASVPVIRDTDLTPTDDQPLLNLTDGPLMSMSRSSWRGSAVSVKSLRDAGTEHLDLLITELQYCSQLLHPHLLQLMAVSVSDGLLRTSLVFERVDVGTLHNLLHTKQAEFPVLQESWILTMILQVCEGLQFLHRGALVMRALSSHSVVLTHLNIAKLTGLGFMVPSGTTCVRPPHHMALPPCLHRWAAPEVIKQRLCKEEADIYSLCALILELYTDDEPWGTVDLDRIRLAMDSGQTLTVHSIVPQPYHDMVQRGLQHEPQNRTCSLQSLKDTLQQDLKQRLSVEGHVKGSRCASPEQDPGPGVQTTTHHATIEEPVHSGVGSAVSPEAARTNREEERHELRVHQLDRDRCRCSEGCSMRRHSHIPPLSGNSDSDSDDEEYDTGNDDEESGSGSILGQREPDTETKEKSDDLRLPTVDQQISTILVNLKVSKELLRQAHRSLDTVEKHHQLVNRGKDQLVNSREDQLDSVAALRDASPCIFEAPSCTSFFPVSPAGLRGVSTAVGPPSERYNLRPQGGDYWTENLTDQLLSRDFKLLNKKELSLWLSLYPAMEHIEQSPSLSGLSSGEPDLCSEENSWYVSAIDDSVPFNRKQQNQHLQCLQKTSSSEEDADVTEEVCRPKATGTQLQGTHNTKYESFSKRYEETDADAPVTNKTTMTQSEMALLAELSSITCSPAQPQQKICSLSVNTPALPYNSTPHCPDAHQRVRIMKTNLPQSPGFNSSQPSPFSVDSSCTPQTFITALLQEDTPSPFSPVLSTKREEHREQPEEEVESAGASEPEQKEGDGTSFKHPQVNVEEEEEEQEEEEEEVSQHARDNSNEQKNMDGQVDEEECGRECNFKKEHFQGSSHQEEVNVVCSEEEELFDGGSDEDEAVQVCFDKKEAVGECSDEEEAVGECSDEEAVEQCSDEDEALGKYIDEDEANGECTDEEAAVCELQKGAGALIAEKKNECLMESKNSLLEDTDRAHSTLDDALQELISEETTQSPGRDVRTLCALFEGQIGDHGGQPAGQRHT